jgi:hypothetical protein
MDIGDALKKRITPLANLQIGKTVSDAFSQMVGAGGPTIPAPTVDAPIVPAPEKAPDFDTQLAAIKTSIETITGTGTGATAPKPLVLPPPTTATFISGLLDADNAMLLYIQSLGVLATTQLTIPAPNVDEFVKTFDLMIEVPGLFVAAFNAAMGGGGGGGKGGKKKKGGGKGGMVIPAPETDQFIAERRRCLSTRWWRNGYYVVHSDDNSSARYYSIHKRF